MTLRIRIKLTMMNVIGHNTANINVLKHIIVCMWQNRITCC